VSFIIFAFLLNIERLNLEERGGRDINHTWGNKKCVQHFYPKSRREGAHEKHWLKSENNNKINLREMECKLVSAVLSNAINYKISYSFPPFFFGTLSSIC
jgi:hypothetical protein